MSNSFIKQVLPNYTAKGTLSGRQTSSIKEVGEKPNTIKLKQPLIRVYVIIVIIALILSWLYLLI